MAGLATSAARARDRLTRRVARIGGRLRRRGRPALAWTVRLTAAAVASYVAAELVFPHSSPPLLAALTALLVVRLTPVSILVSGLDRVVSVVVGVSLAVVLSSALGLTWWSLGLLIGMSLLLGQLLRLGSNLLEVPISAMLVLGAGAADAHTAAGERIGQTMVGAAVGVLSNLLLPPRVVAVDAAVAIETMADKFAHLLEQAGRELGAEHDPHWLADRAGDWLGRARRLTHDFPNVGAALLQAEESRRLNLRALGTPDAGPGLRQGLEALEHSAVAVRSMFATLETVARRRATEGRVVDPQVRVGLAVVLAQLATGLRSFGRLVRQEARPTEEAPDVDQLRSALQGLHEARARAGDLLLVAQRHDPSLSQLISALVGTVERLQRELDLDERIRRQLQRQSDVRRPTSLPQLARPHLTRAQLRRPRLIRLTRPPRD